MNIDTCKRWLVPPYTNMRLSNNTNSGLIKDMENIKHCKIKSFLLIMLSFVPLKPIILNQRDPNNLINFMNMPPNLIEL